MAKINGGATLWARQTLDSDIFCNKPDKWFKIWFYLINEVNHKDNRLFPRGSCFMKYDWIMKKTKANKNEIDHCIRWLKSATMIATRKATRGFIIKVINYNGYQSLENYKSDTKSDSKSDLKAKQKRNKSDTIYKNGKNGKNEEEIKEIKEVRNQVSASLKKKPKANDIEFDQELLSWHGVDEDIYDDWVKRFPGIDVPVELIKIREYFKNNPDKAKEIEKKFEGRMPIYINDWLERAVKYKIADSL